MPRNIIIAIPSKTDTGSKLFQNSNTATEYCEYTHRINVDTLYGITTTIHNFLFSGNNTLTLFNVFMQSFKALLIFASEFLTYKCYLWAWLYCCKYWAVNMKI